MRELLHRADAQHAAQSQLSRFARLASRKIGLPLDDYAALHAFSVESADAFWRLLVEDSNVLVSGELDPVCTGDAVETARFFPRLRLSWTENVLAELSPSCEEGAAIVGWDERGRRTEISRKSLRRRVRTLAAALAARGLRGGDRVAAVARNTIETIVACLAVTSLGATWSSVAPDMGPQAALSRFAQLEPKFLFVHAKAWLGGARVEVPVRALASGLPTLKAVILLEDADLGGWPDEITLNQVEREGSERLTDHDGPWERFPFDQPLFILFSSGTTGSPKAILHGHGGTLLEHVKEHRLHCDLRPSDRLCFQTSTGWMMWNWMVSALATGATLVVYDGSVSYPERDSLLQVVARERVSVFGTSPAYLRYLFDAGIEGTPALRASLREILSTGSVLPGHLHRWAKDHLADVPMQSISGGTDIVGCFVLGSPWTPTHEGESSCLGLGMDVRVWAENGLAEEGRGELVCARPFPSRPLGLIGDPQGKRFHDAYFVQHDGVWTHGDLVELSRQPHGTSARILGRCDGVMNIHGIRIGPGEIYEILSTTVPEVAHAMAVDQDAPLEPGGRRLVLFVVTRPGLALDRPLALRIKREIKARASMAHVPAVIVQVSELPVTHSGKPSEAALQDALSGRPVRNRDALRNPGAIDRAIEELLRLEGAPAVRPAAE